MSSEEFSGGNTAPEQSMAALLEAETAAYPELRRGEIIEGVVVGTDRDGILVDIGAKSEGVVPPNEMHCLQPEGASKLSTGDKVLVFVLQPESPEGQIILSLDRARGERGWRVLQDYMDQNQAFEGYVTGSNKGGLLVNVEGVNAFVPLSQIVSGPDRSSPEATQRALTEWVGRNITLKVIELNRRRNRAILSERAAVQEKRAAEKERLLQELQEGDIKTGRITSIRDFGIFVDIGGADGLVHLSELSWERTPKSPHDLFKVGDEIPVYVLKVDNETKKIALSVRRAQPERWEEIVSNYREGQIVPGQITKLAPFGAFVRLEGPIEGLIHISELVDRRINHPREVVDEGDVVPVKIVRIEYDRHRLGLSLRQARDQAESDGWAFADSGRPTTVPQEAMDALGVTDLPVRAEPESSAETYSTMGAEAVEQPGEDVTAEAAAPEEAEMIDETTETAEAAAEAAAPEVEAVVDEATPEAEAAADEVTADTTTEEPPAPADEVAEDTSQSDVREATAEEVEDARAVAEEVTADAEAEELSATADEVAEDTSGSDVPEVTAEEVEDASAVTEEVTADAETEDPVAPADEVAEEASESDVPEATAEEAEDASAVAEEVAAEAEEPSEPVSDAQAEAEPVASDEPEQSSEEAEAENIGDEFVEDSQAEAAVIEDNVTEVTTEALNTVDSEEES